LTSWAVREPNSHQNSIWLRDRLSHSTGYLHLGASPLVARRSSRGSPPAPADRARARSLNPKTPGSPLPPDAGLVMRRWQACAATKIDAGAQTDGRASLHQAVRRAGQPLSTTERDAVNDRIEFCEGAALNGRVDRRSAYWDFAVSGRGAPSLADCVLAPRIGVESRSRLPSHPNVLATGRRSARRTYARNGKARTDTRSPEGHARGLHEHVPADVVLPDRDSSSL
jgi:hypothetical protein